MGIACSCATDVERGLFSAIEEGDVQQVSTSINKKSKIINRGLPWTRSRVTPLHYAAIHGQAEVLKLLLEKGGAVNSVNRHHQTPLMLACRNGRVACVDLFVQLGADILMFDGIHGRTCLHYAAKSGHLDCTEQVLNAAQSTAVAQTWGFVQFLNMRDRDGATPLHLAARYSHAPVVRLLLSKGSFVGAITTRSGGSGCGFGNTPLHLAARGGSTECVKELLAWGADRTQRNSQGQTPFYIAMKYCNIACASLLNPHSAEPLVWPSPWKFISDLDPDAKVLLEAALTQANDAWEKKLFSSRGGSVILDSKEKPESTNEIDADNDDDDAELCCICFEHTCTIEVQDCGHLMCASCTLALCCHNKPNPAMPNSPAPACPFCRRTIVQLKCAEVKAAVEVLLDDFRDDEKEIDTGSVTSKCKRSAEGSSSIMGLVGRGSFRILSTAAKSSGLAADLSFKDCVTEQDVYVS
ncbi:hypothetical protein KP509_04G048700 [Ceratopteris richardii]|uniref:RING-type E3 ubiquitin transferase n=1 Tax=Ceratopteris richardii TaxID=49495 RepID=A0A8T2USS4_CERRI|nr:hypothetical protein KP509_04G048700 [Ceratopteris richardii]KAH7439184.1 hypothetical protein KP509_04G048700 [Ceratopteris richardii]KAH7439185.1 hypothetical protein KP509_04G048700 [Ceratopteris richardii]KAH7439186.1 hypothetical protein KP509_04G048700 [Ceratopteris richardii]KAH7439187.1 hypothetical protein KP509_04G048700 [Ceratopteris richardii]